MIDRFAAARTKRLQHEAPTGVVSGHVWVVETQWFHSVGRLRDIGAEHLLCFAPEPGVRIVARLNY
jgi:hypothetical protein